ncbi:MAG: DUF4863 family protein [Myxococcota bacterium]
MSKQKLINHLTPLLVHLKSLDLSAVEQSRTELESEFPIDGQWASELKKILIAHQDADWLFPSSHRDIRFGQLCDAQAFGISIDTVDMDKAGPSHLHLNGEVDIAFSIEGKPKFDGNGEGWTVYPPNSWHRPTVTGGRMIILYFLPGAALKFCREAPEGAVVYH